MSGARSRNKGKKWEQLCARELAAATGLDVVTTRALGATYGADLCMVTHHDILGRPAAHVPHVLGWSIECKAVVARNPKAWLRQARDQAIPGATPVVFWKRPNKSFGEGSVFVDDRTAPRGWTEEPIEEFLRRLTEEAA